MVRESSVRFDQAGPTLIVRLASVFGPSRRVGMAAARPMPAPAGTSLTGLPNLSILAGVPDEFLEIGFGHPHVAQRGLPAHQTAAVMSEELVNLPGHGAE